MRRSTTLKALVRREAVLVSCLAVAAAVAAVAEPLGVPWLRIAGAIIAAVGALARGVVAVQRARLEGEGEQAESTRRLRVPAAPISMVDPTRIGVDPAAQTILPGDVVPSYIARTVDQALQTAIAAGFEGSEPWLVVVVGRSKIGKSRSLFEALCQSSASSASSTATAVRGHRPP